MQLHDSFTWKRPGQCYINITSHPQRRTHYHHHQVSANLADLSDYMYLVVPVQHFTTGGETLKSSARAFCKSVHVNSRPRIREPIRVTIDDIRLGHVPWRFRGRRVTEWQKRDSLTLLVFVHNISVSQLSFNFGNGGGH